MVKKQDLIKIVNNYKFSFTSTAFFSAYLLAQIVNAQDIPGDLPKKIDDTNLVLSDNPYERNIEVLNILPKVYTARLKDNKDSIELKSASFPEINKSHKSQSLGVLCIDRDPNEEGEYQIRKLGAPIKYSIVDGSYDCFLLVDGADKFIIAGADWHHAGSTKYLTIEKENPDVEIPLPEVTEENTTNVNAETNELPPATEPQINVDTKDLSVLPEAPEITGYEEEPKLEPLPQATEKKENPNVEIPLPEVKDTTNVNTKAPELPPAKEEPIALETITKPKLVDTPKIETPGEKSILTPTPPKVSLPPISPTLREKEEDSNWYDNLRLSLGVYGNPGKLSRYTSVDNKNLTKEDLDNYLNGRGITSAIESKLFNLLILGAYFNAHSNSLENILKDRRIIGISENKISLEYGTIIGLNTENISLKFYPGFRKIKKEAKINGTKLLRNTNKYQLPFSLELPFVVDSNVIDLGLALDSELDLTDAGDSVSNRSFQTRTIHNTKPEGYINPIGKLYFDSLKYLSINLGARFDAERSFYPKKGKLPKESNNLSDFSDITRDHYLGAQVTLGGLLDLDSVSFELSGAIPIPELGELQRYFGKVKVNLNNEIPILENLSLAYEVQSINYKNNDGLNNGVEDTNTIHVISIGFGNPRTLVR